jgi:ribonuclease D
MDQRRETNASDAASHALIDRQSALEELVAAISGASLVGIDTEFVRERTYYPQLCLVQAATPANAGCVDCLANLELEPLFSGLVDPRRTWVIHSARQDLEVVRHYAGASPTHLIDTQLAAALTGRAPQVGLQDLLRETLGVELGKGFTRTDWSRRPLPQGALQYALEDVMHLLPLWHRLEEELADLGRLEWLHEDCRRLLEESAAADPLVILSRLKGLQALDADSQAAALALVEWREATARKLDRPRRWIMSDELLTRIALGKPPTSARLEAVADMPRRLASRWGSDILGALENRDRPEVRALLEGFGANDRPDKQEFKQLQRKVREQAADLGIESEVLATRRDLSGLLTGRPPAHLRTGWRAAVLEPLLS